MKTSRQAGMAEVATGVLHNVGNVLNSVNVSTDVLRQTLRNSEVKTLTRVAGLLKEHSADMEEFLTVSQKGRMLPGVVIQLAERLEMEHATLNAEQEHLARNVEHIKNIVAMQQSYATVSGIREKVRLADLLRDVLQLHAVSFARHGIEVIREYENLPEMIMDKHKVLQILVNLASNARQAIDETMRRSGRIHVSLQKSGGDRVRVSISDDGVGIPPENFTRIFSHGFTTRQDGHGFGLHSGALAAREMGGSLTVDSAGAGLGATFTLELPIETVGAKG
ncbi:MAG TPA: HAMP domain-containing sensor histidine kinase [Opitutaceae bacterium]|nr:HAMP domain-containing sensor histidine kinase [Opitutaceae bacterium]